MSERWKSFLIGLFILAAIAASVKLVFFLEPKIGDGEKTLTVRFSNIPGVSLGTRVHFAGKPVGEVTSIQEEPEARVGRIDELGRVYFYLITMALDSTTNIYRTDEVSLSTNGLMGERAIAITPKSPPTGENLQLVTDGEILFARSSDSIETTVRQIGKVAQKMEKTIDDLDTIFHSLAKVAKSVGDSTIIPSLNQACSSLEKTLAKAGETQVLEKLVNLVDHGSNAMVKLCDFADQLGSDQGTLGKLINNDDLYLRVTDTIGKATTLMNDINHYGLLFQYDKSWQRQRKKRAHQLESVATPAQFRSYFETELDTIQTAFTRLTILMEKGEEMNTSERFRKDFAHLMKRMEELSGALHLYNERFLNMAQ